MAQTFSKTLAKGASPMKWDDMKKLSRKLEADGKNKLSLYILFASMTGYRSGDIRGMKWKDILGCEYYYEDEQKTKKGRMVKLSIELQHSIQRTYEACEHPSMDSYVFAGRRTKGYWTIQYLNSALKDIKRQYLKGFSGQFSTHTFRKTFGKRVYDLSEDKHKTLIMLCHIFNHSNLHITMRYIGVEAAEIENIYDNLF